MSDGVHSGWKGGRRVETATCRTSYHNLLRPTLEVTYTLLRSAGAPRSLLQQLTAKVVLYTRTRSKQEHAVTATVRTPCNKLS